MAGIIETYQLTYTCHKMNKLNFVSYLLLIIFKVNKVKYCLYSPQQFIFLSKDKLFMKLFLGKICILYIFMYLCTIHSVFNSSNSIKCWVTFYKLLFILTLF